MAARTLLLGMGLALAACGTQPQSASASNDTAGADALAVNASAAVAEASPEPVAPANAAEEDYTIDRTNASAAEVVGDILRRVGTLDGDRITGFDLRDSCTTVLTTAKGDTVIDWHKVKDWAARLEGGQRLTPIDDGQGAHVIGVPSTPQAEPVGDAGARVESGFSGFADSCQS